MWEDFFNNCEVKELNGNIEFENVIFVYFNGSGVFVLKDLLFFIKSG